MTIAQGLMSGALTLIVLLLIAALKGIGQINGGMQALNQWKQDHEKSDDRQFKELKEAVAGIWRRLST